LISVKLVKAPNLPEEVIPNQVPPPDVSESIPLSIRFRLEEERERESEEGEDEGDC